MGVKGLWKLLRPAGKAIELETLSTKWVAVDISIWLVQFVKAMRDEQGMAVIGAHIIGLIRRIIKLLQYRIKPVFVFDGPAPALKQRILQLRQQKRKRNQDQAVRIAVRSCN